LLEQARPALGDDGYPLQAAIRTLGYVTELLENQEATQSLRRLLWVTEHGEDREGVAAGRH
jgi:hypothetical protein